MLPWELSTGCREQRGAGILACPAPLSASPRGWHSGRRTRPALIRRWARTGQQVTATGQAAAFFDCCSAAVLPMMSEHCRRACSTSSGGLLGEEVDEHPHRRQQAAARGEHGVEDALRQAPFRQHDFQRRRGALRRRRWFPAASVMPTPCSASDISIGKSKPITRGLSSTRRTSPSGPCSSQRWRASSSLMLRVTWSGELVRARAAGPCA